jgi:hypothetical protein
VLRVREYPIGCPREVNLVIIRHSGRFCSSAGGFNSKATQQMQMSVEEGDDVKHVTKIDTAGAELVATRRPKAG